VSTYSDLFDSTYLLHFEDLPVWSDIVDWTLIHDTRVSQSIFDTTITFETQEAMTMFKLRFGGRVVNL
jgi:hypothetical protein